MFNLGTVIIEGGYNQIKGLYEPKEHLLSLSLWTYAITILILALMSIGLDLIDTINWGDL